MKDGCTGNIPAAVQDRRFKAMRHAVGEIVQEAGWCPKTS